MLLANSVTAQSIDIGYRNEVETKITQSFTSSKQEAIQAAKEYANGIRDAVQKEVDDVELIVRNMNNELEYIASDGIITEAEKAAINKMLQTIQKEKQEADQQYNELYNNAYLTGSESTNLYQKYQTLYGSSSTSKYNVLIQRINSVLQSTTGPQIQSNMSVYKTAFSAYASALADYKRAIETAVNKIAEEHAIEQGSRAEQNSQNYTDNTVRVAKETIQTSINNLENKINLSVTSVKEVAARKNYVKNGEQETLSQSAFSISGPANVSVSEYMNMKCLKIEFYSSGGVTIEQYLGELEAGEYTISVATAYPSSNQRPNYIGYGFSGNRTNEYYSNFSPEQFKVFSKKMSITKATKYVSNYIYGYSGNVCYITNIRVLRDMQELLDDLDARLKVEVGKVSASVENIYKNTMYNYCTNGAFTNGYDGFEGWERSDSYQIVKTSFNGKNCIQVASNSSTQYIKYRVQPFNKSGPVTVRFKAACASGYEHSRMQIRIDGGYFYTNSGELSTTWKTFEFSGQAVAPYFDVYINNYTLTQGTKVGVCETVKDKSGDAWYYVKITGNQGEKYGFVAAAYITKQTTSKPNTEMKDDGVISKTPQWTGKVTADVLNVRSWAGTNNPLIKSWPKLNRGNLVDVCDVVNATDGSRWYYIRIAEKYYGFVHSAYIARS